MAKSKTYKNITDSGYTTYHKDGSKSSTYKNITNDGYTTYHDDGSKSVSYKNITNSGYSTYHVSSGDGEFDFLILIFAGGTVFLSVLALISLGKSAIFALLLMAVSVIARIVLNKCLIG